MLFTSLLKGFATLLYCTEQAHPVITTHHSSPLRDTEAAKTLEQRRTQRTDPFSTGNSRFQDNVNKLAVKRISLVFEEVCRLHFRSTHFVCRETPARLLINSLRCCSRIGSKHQERNGIQKYSGIKKYERANESHNLLFCTSCYLYLLVRKFCGVFCL